MQNDASFAYQRELTPAFQKSVRWIWFLFFLFLLGPLVYSFLFARGVNSIAIGVISGQSVHFLFRLLFANSKIKLNNGVLQFRSMGMKWQSDVPLNRIHKVENYQHKRPVLMGIFAPAEGLKVYAGLDEFIIERPSSELTALLNAQLAH